MDNATAFKTIDRLIQQYDALAQLKSALTAAKNAERFLQETEAVVKRKRNEISELDAKIDERKAEEATIKERGDAIVRNAISQANQLKLDAKKESDEERARRGAETAKATERLSEIRKSTEMALVELNSIKGRLASENAALTKVINERKAVTDAIMKLASGAN